MASSGAGRRVCRLSRIFGILRSHVRRRFQGSQPPGQRQIASNPLRRTTELYKIEDDIRGVPTKSGELRGKAKAPNADSHVPRLIEQLALISQKTGITEAICYTLSRWKGLTSFIDDGRIHDRHQSRLTFNRFDRPQLEECVIRRLRRRSRISGDNRLTH